MSLDVLKELERLLDERRDQGGTISRVHENDAILRLADKIRADERERCARPEEKTYILLATEKGLTPIGKLVDALTTFVKAEESFVASVKPGVIDDHLSEAYYKASAALKQFSMYTDNIAVSQPEPQPNGGVK